MFQGWKWNIKRTEMVGYISNVPINTYSHNYKTIPHFIVIQSNVFRTNFSKHGPIHRYLFWVYNTPFDLLPKGILFFFKMIIHNVLLVVERGRTTYVENRNINPWNKWKACFVKSKYMLSSVDKYTDAWQDILHCHNGNMRFISYWGRDGGKSMNVRHIISLILNCLSGKMS